MIFAIAGTVMAVEKDRDYKKLSVAEAKQVKADADAAAALKADGDYVAAAEKNPFNLGAGWAEYNAAGASVSEKNENGLWNFCLEKNEEQLSASKAHLKKAKDYSAKAKVSKVHSVEQIEELDKAIESAEKRLNGDCPKED